MPDPQSPTSGERARPGRQMPAPRTKTGNAVEKPTEQRPTGQERWKAIAELAYGRAQQRGFSPGGEVEDWLAAEREFDAGGASSSD